MSIELAKKFLPYTDEQFATESNKSLLTNQDFSWSGAHSVRVYKVTTSRMNDYGRSGPSGGNWSRYGAVESLHATTQEMILKKDRSFTFAIDALDEDKTAQQLAAASALARQNREVVIPEVDAYTYGVMCANAGHKPAAKALTAENIYTEVLAASEALDNAGGHTRRLCADEKIPRYYHGNRCGPGYASAGYDWFRRWYKCVKSTCCPFACRFWIYGSAFLRYCGSGQIGNLQYPP